MADVFTGSVFQNSSVIVMARIKAASGAYLVQSDLTSISMEIWRIYGDSREPGRTAGPTAVTVASAVYNTLQTGGLWEADDTGYNFLYECPNSGFNDEGVFRVEIRFTPTSGQSFVVKWEVTASRTLVS